MDTDALDVLARIAEDLKYATQLLEQIATNTARGPLTERLAYSYPEAAAVLGLTVDGVRELLSRGELVALPVGSKRSVISVASLLSGSSRAVKAGRSPHVCLASTARGSRRQHH